MATLRLAAILQRHKDRCGSLQDLAQQIYEANGQQTSVHPRKLAEIIKGSPSSLKMADLAALNAYLLPFGESLADLPLFADDNVLQALVGRDGRGYVDVLVPTRIDQSHKRDYASIWDVRAFSTIVERINARWPETRVRLCEKPAGFGNSSAQAAGCAEIFRDSQKSYCSIGAPLIFPPSEYMLAQIFEVRPFVPPPALRHVNLPFYFVWYPDLAARPESLRISSAFEWSAGDIEESVKAESFRLPDSKLPELIRAGKAHAMLIEDHVFPVYLDREEWKDYGVIVAQRRPSGEVWVVVAGLSGPGTLAAAESLGDLALAVPESELGQASPPVYAVVESAVCHDPEKSRGDARKVVRHEIMIGPKVWQP